MLKKKFFAKALAFAMATGLLAAAAPVGPTAQVLAEDQVTTEKKATPVTAEVRYDDYKLVITPGKDGDNNPDQYVFIEVLKKEDDTKQGTIYPYSCKELAVDGKVTVDLSFLKAAKPSYLKVWGDKSTKEASVKVTVVGQPAKIKFKYAAQTFPVLAEGKEATDAAYQKELKDYYLNSFGITEDKVDYEFKTLYGKEWAVLPGASSAETAPVIDGRDMFATMKVAGTTLIIRQAAVENKLKADSTEIEKAGAPAGTEVKVKIPAAPKAPKVTIDYVKGTLKLPKNSQYGMVGTDGSVKYTDCKDGGALGLKEIVTAVATAQGLKDEGENKAATTFVEDTLKAGFTLIVRTNDVKKGISLPAFVDVKEVPTFTDDENGKLLGSDGKTAIATYEFTDKDGAVLTFSSGAFEYKDVKGNWKKLTSGKGVKGVTTLTVRIAGVKAKDVKDASFPSVLSEVAIAKDLTEAKLAVKGGAEAKVEVGKTLVLELTAKDKKGETVDVSSGVTWASKAESTATVAAGTVTPKAAGKVTITATITIDGKEVVAEIEVEVVAAATSGT